MAFTPCGKYLVSFDTLNKVMVLNFPKVCLLQSVNVDRKLDITDFCIFDGHVATLGQ